MRRPAVGAAIFLLAHSSAALSPTVRPRLVRRRAGPLVSQAGVVELQASAPEKPPQPPPMWPCGDALDQRIRALSVPAVVSFMILPLAQATDLFWVGRMGEALALAGQAAANQVYSSLAMVTSTIPTILAPRVAQANAKGDKEAVQEAVGESLFLSAMLGLALSAVLWAVRRGALLGLSSVNALPFALPYLASRLPGVVLEGAGIVSFAAFRGMMDTVTPLQVSAASNLINVCLDPLLIFTAGLGVAGAGAATTVSQLFAAAAYLRIMLRRGMLRLGTIRPPSAAALKRIAGAGGAVQLRAVALNVAFLGITRVVQGLDSTGTAAAAHAVTLQLWQLGGVILFALSTVASIIVPSERSREGGGPAAARAAASRLLAWGTILGGLLGALQLLALPLLGLFSPLPEVQRAARLPSIMGAVLQLINGVVFIGEGIMVGTQAFVPLAAAQVLATTGLLLSLRFATTLPSVWWGFYVFNGIRLASVLRFHFFTSPLVAHGRRAHARA